MNRRELLKSTALAGISIPFAKLPLEPHKNAKTPPGIHPDVRLAPEPQNRTKLPQTAITWLKTQMAKQGYTL